MGSSIGARWYAEKGISAIYQRLVTLFIKPRPSLTNLTPHARKGDKAKEKGRPVTFTGNLLTDEERKNVTISDHTELVTGWDNMLDHLERHWEVVEELEDDSFLMKKSLPRTSKMRTRRLFSPTSSNFSSTL